MKLLSTFFLFVALLLAQTNTAQAIPPPDFLFQIGSQVVQFFSIAALFLSALFLSASRYLQLIWHKSTKKKRILFVLGGVFSFIVVSIIALGGIFMYGYDTSIHGENTEIGLAFDDLLPDKNTVEPSDAIDLSITNEEFRQLLDTQKKLFILDAREVEEYDIGHFTGSTNIRFADLLLGKWQTLPKNENVYVFCWSGMRGKEVADFLQLQGIKARFLKDGANGWFNAGGAWEGDISFASRYNGVQYTRLVTLTEVKQHEANGMAIIDSRNEKSFEKYHIPGSINIPILHTPSEKIEELLLQIQPGKTIVTVCDDFISCFDAKITGIKFEKLGYTFLGRYNKPWEYRTQL